MELALRGFTEKVSFSYTKMATRIAKLIATDDYLTAKEKARYVEIERDYAGSDVPMPYPRVAFPMPAPENTSVHYTDIRNDANEIVDSGYIAHDNKTGYEVLTISATRKPALPCHIRRIPFR